MNFDVETNVSVDFRADSPIFSDIPRLVQKKFQGEHGEPSSDPSNRPKTFSSFGGTSNVPQVTHSRQGFRARYFKQAGRASRSHDTCHNPAKFYRQVVFRVSVPSLNHGSRCTLRASLLNHPHAGRVCRTQHIRAKFLNDNHASQHLFARTPFFFYVKA